MTDPASARLDERYGRTPKRARRDRAWLLAGGTAVGLVLIGWLLWAGLLAPGASLEARDTGYSVVDDHEVSVQWRLTVDPGVEARCAVHALSDSFAIVGWKIVDVPPSDQHVRLLSDTVRTSELATTGLIYRCWTP
ncbi:MULTISPECIES: DUF4307 domain-containing protein [unclassified Salinibacterium]|uniref:DUF4307 domain-containing protein n=1 Tax=unclassified Salinibacterium TaxID=2632331 RepID=UPI001421B906|nr:MULTISPECIES: DUF4307 domain-containing protein [unclassified Salinibacterium]